MIQVTSTRGLRNGSDRERTAVAAHCSRNGYLAQENAKRTLEAGITAVRDLGSTDYMDIAMRNLINRGAMQGPRMFVSGWGLRATIAFRPGDPPPAGGGIADSPEEVTKVVRRQIAAGADVIKMYGSIGGFDNVGTQQTFTYDEMKAAVDVAHAMGKRIAIHSYGPDGARDAVRAGTYSLECSADLDLSVGAKLADAGTELVKELDGATELGGAAKLQVSSAAKIAGRISFAVVTTTISAIGEGDTYSQWILQREDRPLTGGHCFVQVALVPEVVKQVSVECRVSAVVTAAFGMFPRQETKRLDEAAVPVRSEVAGSNI